MLKKITKEEVIKKIEKDGRWSGYLVPSSCYPNIGHPFSLAMSFNFTTGHLFRDHETDLTTPFERIVNEFEYYNCNEETGLEIHFYEKDDNNG